MNLKIQKSLILLLSLSMAFGVNTYAAYSQENKLEARLIDEYEQRFNWEYEQVFFDKAFLEYQNAPNSKIVVIVYGKPASVFWKSRTIKYYLKNQRGCGDECVKVIEGGNESPAILQTWLVSKDAEEPKPKSLISYAEMKSKPYRVGVDVYEADFQDGWVYETFAEELAANSTAKGYLVFYKDQYNGGYEYLKKVKTKLLTEYKIHSSRIEIVTAKDESAGRIEFYIVPKGQAFRLPQKQKSVKKNP